MHSKALVSDFITFKFEQIGYNNFKSLTHYMEVALALKQLMKMLQSRDGVEVLTKKQCFPKILKLTNVAESNNPLLNASTFRHYQIFLKFMEEYPRFRYSNLT